MSQYYCMSKLDISIKHHYQCHYCCTNTSKGNCVIKTVSWPTDLPGCWLFWISQQPAQLIIKVTEQLGSQHLVHVHQGVRDIHPISQPERGGQLSTRPGEIHK